MSPSPLFQAPIERPVPLPAPPPERDVGPGAADDEPGPRHAAVYLRAADADQDLWRALKAACTAAGWFVILDRTRAWHLARSAVLPVVLADFSGQSAGAAQVAMKVARVQAKVDERVDQVPIERLLTARDRERLAGRPWLAERVTRRSQDNVLPTVGEWVRLQLPIGPQGVDIEALRAAIADVTNSDDSL